MGTKMARRRKKCEGKKTKQEPRMNCGREHAGGSPGARVGQPVPAQAAPEQGHTLAIAPLLILITQDLTHPQESQPLSSLSWQCCLKPSIM